MITLLLGTTLITFVALLVIMLINTLGIKPAAQEEKLYIPIKEEEHNKHRE